MENNQKTYLLKSIIKRLVDGGSIVITTSKNGTQTIEISIKESHREVIGKNKIKFK